MPEKHEPYSVDCSGGRGLPASPPERSHRPISTGRTDPHTDIDETLTALTDLAQAGKIRSFGASKVAASQIVEAQ